jgi:acetolactate synthase-1/2/3 large subunit
VFVFNDGELAQIAQAQETQYNRKTCTVLAPLDIAGVAQATGAEFLRMDTESDIERVMQEAFAAAQRNRPVLVDVAIDYSKRTRFTEGIVKTNLERSTLARKRG